MARELEFIGALENHTKCEFAENYLENDSQNLQKLGELFEECRPESKWHGDVVNHRLMHFLTNYRGLIQLNDQRLLETLMSNRFFLQTFGALEWDNDALFEELVPVKNSQSTNNSPSPAKEQIEEEEKKEENDRLLVLRPDGELDEEAPPQPEIALPEDMSADYKR